MARLMLSTISEETETGAMGSFSIGKIITVGFSPEVNTEGAEVRFGFLWRTDFFGAEGIPETAGTSGTGLDSDCWATGLCSEKEDDSSFSVQFDKQKRMSEKVNLFIQRFIFL
jgi:hypothetical protein